MKNNLEKILKNKIVSFSTSYEDSLTLKNVNFDLVHDKLFVTGEISKGSTTNDWALGRPCSIAWDAVIDFMVFDTELQYEEMINKAGN